ncbi:thioesterase [Micromonospora sp. ALFpr18c]|uniref:thioesterase II family protein n=1 Tax=unclassified Micromonospora TaxID=2617518 RepID=UPI00124B212E|nr:alpha/beta fold hydrolase [Micromonospora sp. ALFpr18c]KAB1943840.1 thioesterase [Micromonospora sp. ALFpr18c]
MSDGHRWFKRFQSPAAEATTLLCLHHAGGNAAMFREWPRLLPPSIDPIAVQLPGRANRIDEPPFHAMDELVDGLVDAVEPLLDRPVAVFGASMGARVGWQLAHALRERELPMLRALYVSASSAPSLDREVRGWDGPDEGLVQYMQRLGGTPAQFLDDPELLAGIVATLRADLTVLSTHTYQPDVLLDIPITAFAGVDDEESTPQQIEPWGKETTGPFVMNVIEGGHFLDTFAMRLVTDAISEDLR